MSPASQALKSIGETTIYVSGGTMLLVIVGIIVFCAWALSDVPDEVRMAADSNAPAPVRGYGCVNLMTAVILVGVALAIISALLGDGK